jgi:hypothetical protein
MVNQCQDAQKYHIRMERIGLLIDKLEELHRQNASPDQLLHVLQMLQTELFLVKQQSNTIVRRKIAVVMPAGIAGEIGVIADQASSVGDAGVSVSKEEEAPLSLQQHKAPANAEVQVKAPAFNVLEEVPTLAHQPQVQELNDVIGKWGESLNEKLSEKKTELAEKLKEEPLRDIKKAIGLNDRYIFITELFRGDEAMYERSLKTINHFSIYPEAEFWIQRELKLKLGWKEDHPFVKQFDQLVRRRFL